MALLAGDPGREPFTVVSIDQDLCSRVYSIAPCEAALGVTGTDKCFNTRPTCQDPENYEVAAEPLELLFGKPDSGITFINGLRVFPSLMSITTSPTRVNVGGRKLKEGSLGKRSTVVATLQDLPSSDLAVDPYVAERTYDPLERSTFWAKFLARNKFFIGRPMRVIEGYVGDDPANFRRRNYIIDKIEGPDSSGKVTIRGSDILRLADNDQALAPELSVGELEFAIAIGETTSLVVIGAGVAADYPLTGGILRIGDEVLTYDSALVINPNKIVMSTLVRGVRGTAAAAQEIGATVQLCLDIVKTEAFLVMFNLLKDFGGIDVANLPLAAWTAEVEKWARGFTVTRLLTEPIGVLELVGELCEQALFYIWWDEVAELVQLRAVRPPLPDELVELSEDFNLLQGSTSLKIRPEERITEVWINYLLRNPVLDPTKRNNYERTRLRIDPTAASPQEYGTRKRYELFSQWLETEAQISPLGFRILSRYRDPLRYLTITLDWKDHEKLTYGTVTDIKYRGFVDVLGQPETVRFEVISKKETMPGERVQYELQESLFSSRYGYIMVNTAPVYSQATQAERDFGAWWAAPKIAGPAEDFPDGTAPYKFI